MDFTCYLPHNSDFEPKDCATYFEENGLKVIISSDYTDDNLKISVRDPKTEKSFHFASYKMDRANYRQALEEHSKYKEALKKCNAHALITTRNQSAHALAITLLSYLHKKHGAKIFNEYNERPLGAKKLADLREKSINDYLSTKHIKLKDLANKYHLPKLIFSAILLIAYFIFDAKVDYGTDMFFFLIVIGIIILWVHD